MCAAEIRAFASLVALVAFLHVVCEMMPGYAINQRFRGVS
jgi:hypothetical protein